MAALAYEIARDQDARSVLTRHFVAMTDRLQRLFPWGVKKNARSQSIRTFSMMVGALTLARAVDDPKLSDEILLEAREMIEGSQSKARQSIHSHG